MKGLWRITYKKLHIKMVFYNYDLFAYLCTCDATIFIIIEDAQLIININEHLVCTIPFLYSETEF